MRTAWRIGVAAAVLTARSWWPGALWHPADARPRTVGVAEVAGAALVPVAPARLLDTRTGVGGALGPGGRGRRRRRSRCSGRGGIPGDAVAVALTVTATEPRPRGYVTVWPAGHGAPGGLQPQRRAGRADDRRRRGGAARARVARSRCSRSPSTHLVVDVTAYWRAAATTDGGRFTPVTPAPRARHPHRGRRARWGRWATTARSSCALAGRGGLPARPGSGPVALTLTATGTTGAGFATAWPGGPRPRVSALNVDPAGEDVAATVIVPVSATGSVSLYVQTASTSSPT